MGGTVTLGRARPEPLGSGAARRWVYDLARGFAREAELLGGKAQTWPS